MVAKLRKTLLSHKGQEVELICDEGRNVISRDKAIITEVYRSIFIVEVYKDENRIQRKSFSYADLMTKVVELCIVETNMMLVTT
ncbi:MAG: Veg family protein [Culicoidibacterales bacterium]